MLTLSNFEVNIWTNVAPNVLLDETVPESFKKIKIKNIDTLDLYKPFEKFFESSYPYILKTDFARILIVKEKGGVYLDSDYMLIRDMEEVISKYD